MIWNKRSLPLLLIRILCAVFFAGAIMSRVEGVAQAGQKTYNAELEYLKVLHEKKVVADPVLTFALMSEYLNANQHRAGIAFFQTLLEDSSNLAPEKKALYLACLGVLRADYADQVPLLRRIRWVKESVALLESARELSGNNAYGIRWLIGTVYAQLPNRFGKKEQAYEELKWLR